MATIILTGGGTAGHVKPNISLLPLIAKDFNRVVYIGSKYGIERELVKKYHNVEYYPITTVKLRRSLDIRNIFIPFLLLKGRKEAKNILKEIQPSVVFSKGGFVSVPVVLASKSLGIPIVSHESDLSMGLANKITLKKVDAICTTFSQTASKIKKAVHTGPPFNIKTLSDVQKQSIYEAFSLNRDNPVLLVLGGSLGAKTINDMVVNNIDALLQDYQIIHITGRNKQTRLRKRGYHEIEYYDDVASIMAISTIAITRGGSNTIWELVGYNVPMLIIPLSKGSRGDQIDNANYFVSKNLGTMLLEEDITNDTFLSAIKKLKSDSQTIKKAQRTAISKDSLNKIYNVIMKCKR